MSTLNENFGRQLRRLRRHKDLTQEQLAEMVGVSTEFISNLERGINAPSFKTLEKLSLAFDIPVKIFFEFD